MRRFNNSERPLCVLVDAWRSRIRGRKRPGAIPAVFFLWVGFVLQWIENEKDGALCAR